MERLNLAQQENIVTLLALDDKCANIISNTVSKELFEGEYRTIAERCIDYVLKYNKAPGLHLHDLFSDILEDEKDRRRESYFSLFRSMKDLYDQGINTKYVIDSLYRFIRTQNLKVGILKAAEKLSKQDDSSLENVEDLLSSILREERKGFNGGMKITEIEKILSQYEYETNEFITGIPQFDRNRVSPARGRVGLFIAPTGAGKTWWLVNLGKHAFINRKKVLHITLEMSEEEVAGRYLQNLFSISKRAVAVNVTQIKKSRRGLLKSLETLNIKPELSFDNKAISEEIHHHLAYAGSVVDYLRIVRFPPRSLTPNDIRAHLDMQERVSGFIPDLIILDYLGIMKTDANNHRITLGRVFEELRAIAVERNLALETAHQASRSGAASSKLSSTHVAEDWSLIGTADSVITYSATASERRYGLARLFVEKLRSDKDKFGVLVSQCYDIGQFVVNSSYHDDLRYTQELDKLKHKDGEDDEN